MADFDLMINHGVEQFEIKSEYLFPRRNLRLRSRMSCVVSNFTTGKLIVWFQCPDIQNYIYRGDTATKIGT